MLVFLFFGTCLIALPPFAPGQAEHIRTTNIIPIDWYLTPAEFPCLTETIHLTGTIEENLHVVINPAGGYSWQFKQTGAMKGLTAVGEDTGAEYLFRGP